jgi:uncharacterized protein
MIRSLLCSVLLVAGLAGPIRAEDTPDIAAIRGRQLFIDGKHDEAFAVILPLAEQGVPRAQVILGFFHERGIGTEVDLAKAVEWYEKGAAQNQPAGLHNLAYSYQYGELGLPLDLTKARELYQQAVVMEYAPSIHNLGQMYLYGEGVEKDVDLGRALIERAVTLGDPEATATLAYILAVGDGLPVDLPRARQLYRIAAAQGIDWAMRDYGEMLELGEGGPVDLADAEEWYLAAQAVGYVMAGHDMAQMLAANAAALPGREVDALAWCLWSQTSGPDEAEVAFTGDCDALAKAMTPEDVTKAEGLAKGF